jgi:hypothetical protein
MNRLRMAVLALALTGTLLAPHAAGAQTAARDSVTGTITEGFGRGQITWTLNVSSGPSGESPTGTIDALFFLGNVATFQATCLQVAGGRAVVGGHAGGGVGVDVQVYLIVVDEPGDTQDRIVSSFFFDDPLAPATCADYDAQSPFEPNAGQSGSVVVTDAQPVPTSKDQCKNGGWRDYPGFNNQGDCVSFVATRGKNQPSG